ncbi:MAG: radical SAM protein [Chloroflexota bacterium]
MNVYHITHSPQVGIVHLHFWGCNLSCRACLLKKELHDVHLAETKAGLFNVSQRASPVPDRYLDLPEIMATLEKLTVKQVVLMGAEPATDRQLPQLAEALHKEFGCHNTLLTNGFIFADLTDIDEVVFSLKAYTDALHRDYTGKSNRKALENFVKYHRAGIKLRTESIFIPEYIDCREIEKIARFIGSVDRTIPYRIDGYIPIGDNPWRRPTPAEMEEATDVARKYLDNVTCLTGNEKVKYEVLKVV